MSKIDTVTDENGKVATIAYYGGEEAAALSPAPATDVQLPRGWLADELKRVEADTEQWSDGMKDSFTDATGIAIPRGESEGGDDGK